MTRTWTNIAKGNFADPHLASQAATDQLCYDRAAGIQRIRPANLLSVCAARLIRFPMNHGDDDDDRDRHRISEETRLGPIRGLWTASVCGLALWAILIGLTWLAWVTLW